MKHQQVSVDFINMIYTACTYLVVAAAAWVFLRLVQVCFSLPKKLRQQINIQEMLQEKVASYEKYILECEAKEKAESEVGEYDDDEENNVENMMKHNRKPIDEVKWKERRECLEMLKKELKKMHDADGTEDWDDLLNDTDDDKSEAKRNSNETNMSNKEEEMNVSECIVEREAYSSNSNVGISKTVVKQDLEVKKDK